MIKEANPTAGFDADPFVLELEETVKSGDFLGCLQCGLCGGACPLGEAMKYTPRKIILHARAGKLPELLSDPSVWMCISCYICALRCPKDIKLTDWLWPALRDKMMQEGGQPPVELQKAFQNVFKYGNPLGESPRKRLDWAKDLDTPVLDLSKAPQPVDFLWIVECYASYYPRNRNVTRSFARILNALKVSWGVLGNKEQCFGDCSQLGGEQGLFETVVEKNLKLLDKYEFDNLLFIDPHAFRALQRFYPVEDASFGAQEHTSFLADRLDDLKPMLTNKVEAKIAYHDNCSVCRRCKVFEPPRKLLQAIPGVELTEMEQNRDNALCCGGGGGGMWLDAHITEHGGQRLSDQRIRQAAAAGANILAVSCPYELSRFEDSAKVTSLENQIKVRDIIELLAESMGINEGGQS